VDWAGDYGVQANYNIWDWQADHAVLTVGKTAEEADGDILVVLTARNIGYDAGNGTVTDIVPDGWTLETASPSPDSTTTNGDGTTTLTWSVTVAGMVSASQVDSQEITYIISRDAGTDVSYLGLDEAQVDFFDGDAYQTNYSVPAAVYNVDVNGDGTVDCPEEEICDGIDNDLDGDIDEDQADTDGDGICDDLDDDCHVSALGGPAYCSKSCPCDEGQGDCDSNAECDDGLSCVKYQGASWGLPWYVDVCQSECHVGADGAYNYCSEDCPCDEGQGDCDTDDECGEGLTCVDDVGSRYGYVWYTDVCASDCHVWADGAYNFCSEDCPCVEGEGDCDSDDECGDGLVCNKWSGADYGLPWYVDVCEPE